MNYLKPNILVSFFVPYKEIELKEHQLLYRESTFQVYRVDYKDLVTIIIEESFLNRKTVVITTKSGKQIYVPFVSSTKASSFKKEFNQCKRLDYESRRAEYTRQREVIQKAITEAEEILSEDRFINHTLFERWRTKYRGIKEIIYNIDEDLLEDKDIAEEVSACQTYFDPKNSYINVRNTRWVDNELSSYKSWFDSIEAYPLTENQRVAVVRDEDATLVIAGAGTGKTSTVTAKVNYLLNKGLAEPEEILVLAFAKKAKKELAERIQSNGRGKVDIRTFHSLGKYIHDESKGVKSTVSKIASDEGIARKYLEQIIDEILTDPKISNKLLHFFVYQLKPFKSSFSFYSQKEYNEHRKRFPLKTLNSETVKSYEELIIANWLFMNGVSYVYEQPYKHTETANKNHQKYHPDFYLPEYDMYLEHFGIDREGNTADFIDSVKYNRHIKWKRDLHKNNGTRLLETYSYDHMEGVLVDRLEIKLREEGVEINPISPEKIKAKLEENGELRQITKLLETFLNLFKSNNYNIADLKGEIEENECSPRTQVFVEIFEQFLLRYEDNLSKEGTIDFHDMIIEATNNVEEGKFVSPYKYIIVDEFQDISQGRAALLQALLEQYEDSHLFAVGDDWQSVYRFAGADIGIMTHFESYFGMHESHALEESFRFNDKILEASTAFITSNPNQLPKNLITSQKSSNPEISVELVSKNERYRQIEQILSDLEKVAQGSLVMLLSRYNHNIVNLPNDLDKKFRYLDIEKSTVHGAKGLEADYVILLDMESGNYGFPTEIADDPVLELLLSADHDFPNAEERRLFYVALTRTKCHVYILSNKNNPSCFVDELMKDQYLELVKVKGKGINKVCCPDCGGRMIKRYNQNNYFWGCEFYPYCTGAYDGCTYCNEGAIIQVNEHFQCSNEKCDNEWERCPKCPNGRLVVRTGKRGNFLGCTNYTSLNCRFTK